MRKTSSMFGRPLRGYSLAFAVAMVAAIAGTAVVVRLSSASTATGNGGTAGHQGASLPVRHVAAAHQAVHLPAGSMVLRLPKETWPRVIPAGFLGTGVEYETFERYAGDNANAVDPVFEQLIRNLSPGQAPQLRIGGDTSDWAWWPVPGMATPPTVTFSLTPKWVNVARTFVQAVGARLIMGINIKADSVPVAVTMSQHLLAGVGERSIEALELGNEPDILSSFGGYPTAPGPGAHPYNFGVFRQAFTQIAGAMPRFALAGPAFTGTKWLSHFGTFLADEPRLTLATVHAYPLGACGRRTSPGFPSVRNLLSAGATYGLARRTVPWITAAHHHGLPIRIDETNASPCPRAAKVIRTFAESLWALRWLFELASVGADGVNVQTTAAATDDLFTPTLGGSDWQAAVQPEYYGLLMFAQAAPPGARLVRLSKSATAQVQAWATRATNGTLRVVIMNLGTHTDSVALDARTASNAGTLERLEGSSLSTQYGMRLGGQTFGSETSTGRLAGQRRTATVRSEGGYYFVGLPALSAAMLTVPSRAKLTMTADCHC